MLILASTFINNIKHAFGEKGNIFLAEPPKLIETASEQWGLADVTPVPDLSYNFVAFANQSPSPRFAGRGQGEGAVVLKIGVPHEELFSEIAALAHYNGNGAVRRLNTTPSMACSFWNG